MLGRRQFLKSFAAGAATAAAGGAGVLALPAAADDQAGQPCVIDMQRNQERCLIDLRTDEGYRAAAWLLRDVRAGNVVGLPSIDTLFLAAWAQAWAAAHGVYAVLNIHSGLRTMRTNRAIEGAAQNSRHLPDRQLRFSAIDLDPFGLDRRVNSRTHRTFVRCSTPEPCRGLRAVE